MTSWTRAVEAAHVATLTALVGVVVVEPFAGHRRADDWTAWLTGQQRVDRVMAQVGPILFLSTAAAATGAALVAAAQHRRSVTAGRATAAVCTAAAIGVTLRVNAPANVRIRAWQPAGRPPLDWRVVRARWERAHRVRKVLVTVGAVGSLWGELRARL